MNSEAESKRDVADHFPSQVPGVTHEEGTIEEFPTTTEVEDDGETSFMSSQTPDSAMSVEQCAFLSKNSLNTESAELSQTLQSRQILKVSNLL